MLNNIKNVVVLMLENRSFDRLLGKIPGVDGVKDTMTNPDYGTDDDQPPDISVMTYDFGFFDLAPERMEPLDNPFGPRVV